MGRIAATDMASHSSLEQGLRWHLQGNHYPPVPLSMVGPCKRAIKNAAKGDWDKRVRLPDGVTWRDQKLAPTWAVVEGHHLEPFVQTMEDAQ